MKATKILMPDISVSRIIVADICLVLAACYLAVKFSGLEYAPNPSPGAVATWAASLILLAVMLRLLRVYADDQREDLTSQLLRIFLGWTGSAVVLLTVSTVLPFVPYAPPHWLLLWCVIGLASVSSYRILLFTRFRDSCRSNVRNMVLVGGGTALANLLWQIEKGSSFGRDEGVLGVFADPGDMPLHMPPHISVLGNLLDLPAYLRDRPIDRVIVTFPHERTEDTLWMIRQLEASPVGIRVVANECAHQNSASLDSLKPSQARA